MRIVLASSSFFKHGGGIAPYSRELCRALVEKGHQLLVISPEKYDTESWKLNEQHTISLYSAIIPTSVRDEVGVAREMFDKIVKYNPQVLISSDNIYLTSLFPCFADNRVRITISHYYNGTLPKVSACRPEETDWIVALSEAGKQYLLGLPGCCEEQVVVIYNAVHDMNINIADLIQKKSREDILRIVYPGGSSRQKSSDFVLKATKKLIKSDLNWELVWLGPSDRIARRTPHNVQKRILFTGRVPRQKAEEYILNSHCFLLPSKAEGCPMSLLEAMRSGTIPIVSDCPSAMRELVVHGTSGYIIHRGDVRTLNSHLVDIGKSQQLREPLMREARLVYERKLNIDIWINKITNLLEKRRKNRTRLKNIDQFNPTSVYRWHRRRGKWQRPTIKYLRLKFGYPNFSPIYKG